MSEPPPSSSSSSSPWFRNGVYINLEEEDRPLGSRVVHAVKFLRWRLWKKEQAVISGATDAPPEVRALAPEDLAPPERGLKVAWLGHASLYLSAPGLRAVVDPIFGAPIFVRRAAPPPIAPNRLPPPDFLFLTHNHFDHLDRRSIAAIRAQAPALRAIVPSGLGDYVRDLGIADVRPVEWWETIEPAPGVRVTAVPRAALVGAEPARRAEVALVRLTVEAGGRAILIAGDTAMGRHFDRIAERYPGGFDAAALPIGAYSPRWFMQDRHMDPPEAVAAAKILRASVLLPIHWGTLRLTDEPLGEPPIYASRAAAEAGVALRVWRPGDVHLL